MQFEPVQKSKLYQDVVKQIQNMIKQGYLKPGDRLPPERKLSKKLEVSRTAIREALKVLEIMGSIEIKPGEGTFIKETKIEDLLKPFKSAITLKKKLLLDILEVRDVIEFQTAKMAALFSTDKELECIKKAITEAKKDVDMGGLGLKGDNEFHLAIARATHNQVYEFIMILIEDLLAKSREATLKIPGQSLKTIDDHIGIYRAIKAGDADKASALMKKHLAKAKENILNLFDKEAKN
jgi:GntR family transcriptional repressor for pyruvate dehydrogenase complex